MFKKNSHEVFVFIHELIEKKKTWVYFNVIYYFFTAITPTSASSYMPGKTFFFFNVFKFKKQLFSDQINFDVNVMVKILLGFTLYFWISFVFPFTIHVRQTRGFVWPKTNY